MANPSARISFPAKPLGAGLGAGPREVCALALLAALAACAAPSRVTPPAPPVCRDFDFPVYFETGSDQLTPSARQAVLFAAGRVRGCRLGPVEVMGLADAGGAARRNLALSRSRAASVAAALKAAGLPAPTFRIEALGEAGARSPEGEAELMRRRADVVIRASPGTPGKP